MTRENIQRFTDFVELLEPLGCVRWVPLRAEPQAGNERPVSRADLTALAGHLAAARRRERWEDLRLGLAVPFCVLDNPLEAATLFAGGGWLWAYTKPDGDQCGDSRAVLFAPVRCRCPPRSPRSQPSTGRARLRRTP
jgi:hypothetical protein